MVLFTLICIMHVCCVFLTSLPKVIWEEGRVAALSHTYAVKSPLVTMARPKFAFRSTPSRGPIAKPHHLPHPWTQPTYDSMQTASGSDPPFFPQSTHARTYVRTYGRTDRQTDRPTDRPRESLMPLPNDIFSIQYSLVGPRLILVAVIQRRKIQSKLRHHRCFQYIQNLI